MDKEFFKKTDAVKAFSNVLGKIIDNGFDIAVNWKQEFENELEKLRNN